MVKRKGVNHILHLLLSVLTLGAWVFVWIALVLCNMNGWRCRTCGSDQVADSGEMSGIRVWVLIGLACSVLLPLVSISAGDQTSDASMDTLIFIISLVPLIALLVMGAIAFNQRKRKRERLQASRVEEGPQSGTSASANQEPERKPEPEPEPAAIEMHEGLTDSDDYIERVDPGTSAANEYRRRMQ